RGDHQARRQRHDAAQPPRAKADHEAQDLRRRRASSRGAEAATLPERRLMADEDETPTPDAADAPDAKDAPGAPAADPSAQDAQEQSAEASAQGDAAGAPDDGGPQGGPQADAPAEPTLR